MGTKGVVDSWDGIKRCYRRESSAGRGNRDSAGMGVDFSSGNGSVLA